MIKISQKLLNYATSYVIRNGLRWGRYKLDKKKDIKRINMLIVKNGLGGLLNTHTKDLTVNRLVGWDGQNMNDKIVVHNVSYLEMIALIEQYNLWDYFNNIFAKE